ncbi:hypothetical protein PMAYCL1PPCAC_05008, partial [Pristionchus mayeri]
IKEEPLEFKEEPVDDHDGIKQEDQFFNLLGSVNENESMEIKDELVDDFLDMKRDEPIADSSDYYATDEIKEEPEEFKNEPLDEFADIKQEESV